MARVSYVEPDAATPEVREIYEKTLRGKPDNVHKILARRPEMMKNFCRFMAVWGARSNAACTKWCISAFP